MLSCSRSRLQENIPLHSLALSLPLFDSSSTFSFFNRNWLSFCVSVEPKSWSKNKRDTLSFCVSVEAKSVGTVYCVGWPPLLLLDVYSGVGGNSGPNADDSNGDPKLKQQSNIAWSLISLNNAHALSWKVHCFIQPYLLFTLNETICQFLSKFDIYPI